MAYNPNIPQPTDQISVSQGQILNNFQALNPFILGIFDLPPQATPPTFPSPDVGLYSMVSTLTGNDELFITKQLPGPITSTVQATAAFFNPNGWTYLPSGILLKWGTGSSGSSIAGSFALTFPVASTIPTFKNVFSMQTSIYTGGVSIDKNTFVQVIGFTTILGVVVGANLWSSARTSSGPALSQFFYLAIGN